MKIWIAAGASVAALLLLAGCETVSKEQCVAGDWSGLGRADGAQGHPSSRIEDIAKDCGRHGITPEVQAYMSGWHEGVRLYCTPLNGFNTGRQGKSLSSVCPPQLAGTFAQTHALGRRIWTAEDRMRQVERRVSSEEDRMNDARRDLDRLDCRGLKGEDRDACRHKRRRLRDQAEDARYALQDARFELNERRRDYEFTLDRATAEAERIIPGYRGD